MKKYILIFTLVFINVLNLFSQVDMNKLKQLQDEKIIMKLLKAMNKYYYKILIIKMLYKIL